MVKVRFELPFGQPLTAPTQFEVRTKKGLPRGSPVQIRASTPRVRIREGPEMIARTSPASTVEGTSSPSSDRTRRVPPGLAGKLFVSFFLKKFFDLGWVFSGVSFLGFGISARTV